MDHKVFCEATAGILVTASCHVGADLGIRMSAAQMLWALAAEMEKALNAPGKLRPEGFVEAETELIKAIKNTIQVG